MRLGSAAPFSAGAIPVRLGAGASAATDLAAGRALPPLTTMGCAAGLTAGVSAAATLLVSTLLATLLVSTLLATLFAATVESASSGVDLTAEVVSGDGATGAAIGGACGALVAVVTGFVATCVKGVAAPLERTHCIHTA